MTPALDEVSTEYGLLAEAVSFPTDYSSVTYRLRAEAKLAGRQAGDAGGRRSSPSTPSRPTARSTAFYYAHVVKAEKTGEREVTFTLRPARQPRAAADRRPAHHPAEALVGGHGPGRPASATSRRRRWSRRWAPGRTGSRASTPSATRPTSACRTTGARTCRSQVGTNNFDQIRFEYYRDSTVLLEALKGDQYDFRIENSAKNWATGYDFPAVKDGRVVREEFAERAIGPHAGLRLQPAPRRSSRTSACAGRSTSPSTSRR